MEADPKVIAAQFAELETRLEEQPLTEVDKARLKAAIRTSKKPRLAHHLLNLQKGTDRANSLAWVLALFDEMAEENTRLKKYKSNARRAFRSLQNAYERMLRVKWTPIKTSDIVEGKELVFETREGR